MARCHDALSRDTSTRGEAPPPPPCQPAEEQAPPELLQPIESTCSRSETSRGAAAWPLPQPVTISTSSASAPLAAQPSTARQTGRPQVHPARESPMQRSPPHHAEQPAARYSADGASSRAERSSPHAAEAVAPAVTRQAPTPGAASEASYAMLRRMPPAAAPGSCRSCMSIPLRPAAPPPHARRRPNTDDAARCWPSGAEPAGFASAGCAHTACQPTPNSQGWLERIGDG